MISSLLLAAVLVANSNRVWTAESCDLGFDPAAIAVGERCPDDFDGYWRGERERLRRDVPLAAKCENWEAKSVAGKYDYYRVSFATFGGKRVYGFLSVPAKGSGPFPALVNIPGYGQWTVGQGGAAAMRIPDGWITLQMNVHPFDPPERQADFSSRYREQAAALKAKYGGCGNYPSAGWEVSREDVFYQDILLGIDRAVDWLAARGDVDARRIVYDGTSQGGGLGLMLCALNGRFSKAAIYVPALCDHFGWKANRRCGWPHLMDRADSARRAALAGTAPYYDAVHFAARLRIPVRFAVGLADTTCPPESVYAAYNALPSADKAIVNGLGMPHRVYDSVRAALEKWELE